MKIDESAPPTTRRTLLGTGAALAAASLAGCLGVGPNLGFGEEASELVERSVAADEVRELRVTNAIGDVSVAADATDRIDVRVRKRASSRGRLADISVETAVVDGVLVVETRVDDADWFTRRSPSTDVTITVPRGEAGPLVAAVASEIGSVSLTGTRGDTRASTATGDVTATGVDGYLSLRSELGSVTASDVTGIDAASTELGDVTVDLLGLRGDVEIGSDMGSVAVNVADDLGVDVIAESETAVDSDLPLSEVSTGARRVAGRLNGGGHRLHVASEFGDVSLRSVPRTV
jgi:hypothetical protein